MLKAKNVVLICVLVLAGQTLMQAQTASLRGTVTDPSGAVVVGAKITAKNTGTAEERSAETSPGGSYSIPNLPVGIYDVTAEKQGFAPAKFTGVELTVAQVRALDVSLRVAGATNVVEVEGEAVAPLETETAQLSTIVDERRIKDLPLVTRNPYELVLLAPGAIESNTRLGGFSVNGSRERNNNFLLDGVDNNDTSVPGIAGGAVSLNPESTQEFRVITNNFSAEYGRNTGAIIDIVTKGGTNSFHGSAYFFGRYDQLGGARDFFNHNPDPLDPSKTERENPYIRNQYGFSVGGPIIKNRTFFFVNTNLQRFTTTLTNTATVPTEAFKSGVFTFNGLPVDLSPASPNNVFGLSPDPTIQALFALFPPANGPQVDGARALLFYPSPDKFSETDLTVRLDHKFTDKHSIYLRYAYNTFEGTNPFHLDFPEGVGAVNDPGKTKAVSLNFTSLLRPTLVNEAKFGFNRLDLAFNCLNTSAIDQFSTPDLFGRGSDISTSGLTAFGCQALVSNGQQRRTGTWQADDNLTWVKGSHTLKFGFEFRDVYDNGFDSFFSRPNLTMNFFSSFGVNLVDVDPGTPCNPFANTGCEGGTNLQNLVGMYFGLVDGTFQSQFFDKAGTRTANDFRKFRQKEWAGYVQDSWKVRPNLTLNFGLRYEFKGVPYEADGLLSNLFADPSGPGPFTFELVGPGASRSFYKSDRTNFEPRLGFSWAPFKNSRTVIRGGYGLYHDRIFGNLFGNSKGAPPFQRDVQSFPGDFIENIVPSATLVPGFVADNCIFDFATFACDNQGLLAPSLIDPNLKTPYSQNWNFGVQHEFRGNILLEANYVGSKGTRLFRVVDGNPPQPALVAQLLAAGCGFFCTDSGLEDLLVVCDPVVFGCFPNSVFNNTAFSGPALNKSIGSSTYHSLQVKATKRVSHGFQIQGAYTFSHAIDNAPDPLDAAAGNRNFPRNSFNLAAEKGSSDFDLRHRLVINYIWDLPFGKGKNRWNQGVLGRVLEGFSFTGIISAQSGHPYDIFGNVDSEHTNLSNRGSLLGTPTIPAGSPPDQTGPVIGNAGCSSDTLNDPFPFCTFIQPVYGGPGNIHRNTFTGPTFSVWDFSLGKTSSLTEQLKLSLRVEVYNAFNRTQFGQPGNAIASPGTFGRSTGTIGRPDGTTSARQLQLAAKITF